MYNIIGDYMKFKYSSFSVWLKCLTVFLLTVFVLVCIIYLCNGSVDYDISLKRSIVKSFVFYIGFVSVCVVEESRKYVELFDTYIRFNSFRFKKIRLNKNSSEFAVRYEDIYSVEAVRVPLIGLWAVKIGAKNLPEKIRLSRNFRRENLMYTEILKRVKESNPDVYIDEKLNRYLDK